MPEPQPGEVYRHFKGDTVIVESVSTHTETEETLVTYCHYGRLWSRPLVMWNEEVNGEPRFELHGHTLEYIIRHRAEEDAARHKESLELVEAIRGRHKEERENGIDGAVE